MDPGAHGASVVRAWQGGRLNRGELQPFVSIGIVARSVGSFHEGEEILVACRLRQFFRDKAPLRA